MSNLFEVLLMTLTGSVASLFLKKASDQGIIKVLFNYSIYLGGSLYLFSAILNIDLLKHLDYSVVLPLTSLTYIWTLIFAKLLYKEKISVRKVFGVLLISLGAVLISS